MPRREENQAQTSKQGNMWWIPALIGMMMLFVPGGLYVAPIMFLLAVLMRKKNKSKESPETSPSLITLI